MPTDNFQLGLWDGDRYLIKVRVLEGKRLPPSTFIIPDGHGIIGWVRQTGAPLLVRDFETEMESLPGATQLPE